MRKRSHLAVLIMLLMGLVLQPCLEVRAADPPEPVTNYLFRIAGLKLPEPFEISTIYSPAAPGSATPLHTHPGLLLGTILAGELTFVEHTGEIKKYRTGQTYVEVPGEPGLARIEGSEICHNWITVVLPKGVPYTAAVPGEPPPKNPPAIQFQNRVDGTPIVGDYEVITFVHDFVPGAQTPFQAYGGQTVTTPLNGDLTFKVNGVEKVYKAGETFEQKAGEYGQARNTSSANLRVLMAILLPKGQQLVTSAPIGDTGTSQFFPETGYLVSGTIFSYWKSNGGLPIFGYPIDSARQIDGRLTQWFERSRLEEHPENAAPYNIELGLLGSQALAQRGIDWRNLPKVSSAPAGCRYFAQTGHSLCGEFLEYWQRHGLRFDQADNQFSEAESLALSGYPISEPNIERNSSGDMVLTQWFERARYELHPNNPAPYRVLLGRLGAELK